ncbi:MAG: CPBP family glutamic-type intramembrane protease [Propionibacteriaceae bacterium]
MTRVCHESAATARLVTQPAPPARADPRCGGRCGPATRDIVSFLGSDTGQAFLAGTWAWLAVIVLLQILNSVLGEELLFRGLLLPRMTKQFRRWDWVANGVLFALYLHVPWVIPKAPLDTLIVASPSKRYWSALIDGDRVRVDRLGCRQ